MANYVSNSSGTRSAALCAWKNRSVASAERTEVGTIDRSSTQFGEPLLRQSGRLSAEALNPQNRLSVAVPRIFFVKIQVPIDERKRFNASRTGGWASCCLRL